MPLKIYEVIKQRRFRLESHCISHTDKLAHNLIVCMAYNVYMAYNPKNGIRNIERQLKTCIDILKNDCDCEEENELIILMMDREGWKVISRAGIVRTRLN